MHLQVRVSKCLIWHAKIFMFAEKYMASSLKVFALHALQRDLTMFLPAYNERG